ncbi:MAG: LytR/AlgR family response regulator transcription factor, partial [Flavisolibacter sp.]
AEGARKDVHAGHREINPRRGQDDGVRRAEGGNHHRGSDPTPASGNALDYLLKPVEPRRLADAVEKLKKLGAAGALTERPHQPVENNSILNENDQVFVKDGERCWFVKLGEVRLFESVGNYAKVFFGPNKPLILKSLNALEERLDEKVFFRANRKHIVNLRMIDKIEPYFNGGLLLELKGGEKIEVSRRQTVKFKEMMSL